MGNKVDIVFIAPESGLFAVDRTDLELDPFLDRFLPAGGQTVDRQA